MAKIVRFVQKALCPATKSATRTEHPRESGLQMYSVSGSLKMGLLQENTYAHVAFRSGKVERYV